MRNHKEFRETCVAYVLGTLEDKEREDFELFLHRQADQNHLEIYRELRDTAMLLPLAVRQNPPEHLRKQLLDAIQAQHQHTQQSTSKPRVLRLYRSLGLHKPAVALLTLAALLLLGFGLMIYSFMLHQHLDDRQKPVVELHDELTIMQAYLGILESQQLEYVYLDGADHVSAAFGRLICDLDQKRALLQISNLPPLPHDKAYQLWAIKNGQVINKGVVAPREDRVHNFFLFREFEIEDPSEAESVYFAITLEPATGENEPSGEMLMRGSPVML
ncbi:MAG: anti-sigma factor [Balneolales bacterium]